MIFPTTLAVLSLLGVSTLVDAQHALNAAPRRRHHAKKANGITPRNRAVGGPAAAEKALARRDTFTDCRFTYYIVDVGLGSCGNLNTNEDYTVALSSIDYETYGSSYPSPVCGKMITITIGSKTTTAKIQDECPGCPEHGLDMSPGLFTYFADESVGVLSGSWYYNDDSGSAVTSANTFTAAATTSQYVAPTTTSASTSDEPTTSIMSSAAATTSLVAVGNNVIQDTSSSSTSSSAAVDTSPIEAPAPATTSAAAATTSSTSQYVAPTTTSTSVYVAPATTSSTNLYVAASTPAAIAAAATTSAAASFASPASLNCSTVTLGNLALYNGTSALFYGTVNATALYNQVSLVNNTSAFCFNQSLFTITNHTFVTYAPTNYTVLPFWSSNYTAPSNSSEYLAQILLAGSNATTLTNTSSIPLFVAPSAPTSSSVPVTAAVSTTTTEEETTGEEDIPWCDDDQE